MEKIAFRSLDAVEGVAEFRAIMGESAMSISSGQAKARIVLVDDHPAVREGLTQRIERQPDLEVCGEAADVATALQLVDSLHPDVLVVDIALKDGSGLDLIKRLDADKNTVRSLVCSIYDERTYAERSLRAGALGYVMKEEATEQIVNAIRHVRDGKIYLSKKMTDHLLKRSVAGTPTLAPESQVDVLSDRELEVYRLVGTGMETRQIAKSMHISPKTVETYLGRIKQKLHLESGRELILRAIQAQSLDPVKGVKTE